MAPRRCRCCRSATGEAGFTFDPIIGEFYLTHANIRVPESTREFAINASNSRFWEAPVKRYPVKRYLEGYMAGKSGPRGGDFNMRRVPSMVAEARRILMRGGVFLYPRDRKDPTRRGRLRLRYEANPIGFLIEQTSGRASTGARPLLAVQPEALHERIGFVFGSREELEPIERYHAEPLAGGSHHRAARTGFRQRRRHGAGQKAAGNRAQSPRHDIVVHRSWLFLGDGCLMEGISHEAAQGICRERLQRFDCAGQANRITPRGP